VVALNAKTGAVRAMASSPGYDPNVLADPAAFRQLSNDDDARALVNRATFDAFPPGSTFKVVTATAALDSGRFEPGTPVDGPAQKIVSGVPLNNFGNQEFGTIDLTTALTKSVNTVWAEVAETLGRRTMGNYMTRLGFYRKPQLDYPADQVQASGEYMKGRLMSPTSRFIDVGRMGVGQDKLAVTPLQMAMVAAAVANDGKLVDPHLTDRVVDPDGRVVDDVTRSGTRVMKKSTADAVAQMMAGVVREGSGTAAALEGIEVAGKTGTAETNVQQGITQPWFIAFAPIDKPEAAIAVTIERSAGGTGGEEAAPIAKQVLEALVGADARREPEGGGEEGSR
jgi:peptidoglycan glycosyltransferase